MNCHRRKGVKDCLNCKLPFCLYDDKECKQKLRESEVKKHGK